MTVRFDVEAGIATVRLARADKLNALNREMIEGLRTAWNAIRSRSDIAAAILTADGDKAFCAGADLKDFVPDLPSLSFLWDPLHDLRPDRGQDVWKPVIGAVNGHCLGGGMTLLLATDIRVAVPHATFATPEVKWGVIATCGGTQRLMRALPSAIALEMLLMGTKLDAARAAHFGLINRIVQPEELLSEARAMAKIITANAPLAVRATKELALRSYDMPIEIGLRLEDAMGRLLQASEDIREGTAAFADRRQPIYHGR